MFAPSDAAERGESLHLRREHESGSPAKKKPVSRAAFSIIFHSIARAAMRRL
jgi:hypothetical protein